MHYDRKIFLFTNKKIRKEIASNEISMVNCHSLIENCPQASKLLFSHNFSNHYKTMMWPSWRLQGCKEVGPFRDIDWGNSGETAEHRCLRMSVYGSAARTEKLFAPTYSFDEKCNVNFSQLLICSC